MDRRYNHQPAVVRSTWTARRSVSILVGLIVGLCVAGVSDARALVVRGHLVASGVRSVVADGSRYAFFTDQQPGVAVIDDLRQRRRRVAAPATCFVDDALAGIALLGCNSNPPIHDNMLLDGESASVTPVTSTDGDASYSQLGTQWLAGAHCQLHGCLPVYLNRLTGKYRLFDDPGFAARDLDSPDLQRLTPHVAWLRRRAGGHSLYLRSGARLRRLSSCHVFCDHADLRAGQVTWTEGLTVRRYDLRTTRTRS